MSKFLKFRRVPRSLSWHFEADEHLLWLAEALGIAWMHREYFHKNKIKGGLLNKASGILAELTFRSMLDELNVPHTATEPLLDKRHPVNIGKLFDFKLADGTTIDIKALPPHKRRLEINLNRLEAHENGACNYYVLYQCSGDYSEHECADIAALDELSTELGERYWQLKVGDVREPEIWSEFEKVKAKLHGYISKITQVNFVGFVEGNALAKPENVKPGKFGDYYSLPPPFLSALEFAAKVLKKPLNSENNAPSPP